jgi:hypothetical protein
MPSRISQEFVVGWTWACQRWSSGLKFAPFSERWLIFRRKTKVAEILGAWSLSVNVQRRKPEFFSGLGFLSTSVLLLLCCGCGGSHIVTPTPSDPAPLRSDNINLIFVVSEDLAYNAEGDIDATTANLTNQGLQRTLLMAPFLQQNVLGRNNVTGIYALEPMTHLQTANQYPDMVGLETIQQFAQMNQITVYTDPVGTSRYTANSSAINTSYFPAQNLPGASPLVICQGCQGLDFNDTADYTGMGDNESLVAGGIITYNVPGFYIFSAPWETISQLMAGVNNIQGYNLILPATYQGPNYIYTISIGPSGTASLITYNTGIIPPATYPALPSLKLTSTCTGGQEPMHITVTGGVNGTVPNGIATDLTMYMIRHAEAHPVQWFEDGNYVAAGQWRALGLPSALAGKFDPAPTQVYSIDPAQESPSGYTNWSYVRPSLTAEPYAIAGTLPFHLVSTLNIFEIPGSILQSSQYFFNAPPFASDPLLPQAPPRFSGQTVLLAWEHAHFQPTINALLESYHSSQKAAFWPDDDYDTIWTVRIDGAGNLSVDNSLCEGIDSAQLPYTAPSF